MKRILAFAMIGMVVASCSDNNDMPGEEGGQSSAFEADYIGKAVGNFTAEEWYPGGQLGTTDNVTAGCYEDEAPAVNQQGLLSEFNLGETFFERNFNILNTNFAYCCCNTSIIRSFYFLFLFSFGFLFISIIIFKF